MSTDVREKPTTDIVARLDEFAPHIGLAREAADYIRALREEMDLLRARWPRAYILTRASEWARLFREVRGYLHTCHGKHGTDFSGRQHAMNALDQAIKDLEANGFQKDKG